MPAPSSEMVLLSDGIQEILLSDFMSLIKGGLFSLEKSSLHIYFASLLADVSLP